MRAIFVDCTTDLTTVIERRKLDVPAAISINHGSPSTAELIGLCAGYDVILVEHTVVPPQVFDACPTVRTVVFMGTGAGTYVDLADAMRRGIRVLTTPGYGDRAVAEHAFALMFSATRSVARMDREIRMGVWSPTGDLQLRGRTVAVIDLGGIGTEFASMARSVGMDVKAWNRTSRDVAFGGLRGDQVKRLKELENEKENDQLRKAVSDLTLEKLILKEASSGTTLLGQATLMPPAT